MSLSKIIFFISLSICVIFICSCGPSPKEICFSETAISLVSDIFAEQYFNEQLEKIYSEDITFGLRTLGVALQKENALKKIKGAFRLNERLEARSKGDNLFNCEGIFTLPNSFSTPPQSGFTTYKLTYEVKYSKGEKKDYITVRLIDKILMK